MANRPHFNAERRMQKEHPIEKVGMDLRKMMKWIESKQPTSGDRRPSNNQSGIPHMPL